MNRDLLPPSTPQGSRSFAKALRIASFVFQSTLAFLLSALFGFWLDLHLRTFPLLFLLFFAFGLLSAVLLFRPLLRLLNPGSDRT